MSAPPASNGEVSLEKKLEDVKLDPETKQISTQSSSIAAKLRETPVKGPLKTPLVDHVSGITLPPPIELNADQQSKYDDLLETVKSWATVPSTKGKEGPVTEDESETGKQFILGYDIAGRPCHYLNPGRQNTEPSPRQNQHLVFMLERSIEMMGPGQESLALLINFKSSSSRSNTAPGIGQGREVLTILQTHYPERLGRALIVNVPWVVWGFFKLITPFIDPLTKDKLKFNDDMRQHVPPQQLWKEWLGDLEFEYEHETYWPTLVKLCEERFTERKVRWTEAGKHYGESEIYLKGGNVKSIGIQDPLPEKLLEVETIYHRPLNRSKTQELSKASFAYLFGEMVSYAQKRVTGIQDLEKRLNVQGHPIGLKLLDLLLLREPPRTQTRPLNIIALLQFITTTLWRHVFSRPADALEKSSNPDTPDEYMISDNEPLVNQYISIPKEMNQLNCAAYVAGIIEGVCDGAGFPARVTAHSVGNGEEGELWPGKTVFLVKFQEEVVEREAFLGR
ncbi:putative CRAL-TRIO domain-containing protein C23B6.04c [Amylocarpus encephaloides]|uniref:CRAL-TRIO domain-containing protein C23B6.04c n=1 Tax=Amylocarpus encephaloides TaxID=45428 RepID=A0A9P8C8S6_9HELO|nr:putative CRAL-TRIO domain-containing protein C23B6.04c [Amylocarpus encephaloides]